MPYAQFLFRAHWGTDLRFPEVLAGGAQDLRGLEYPGDRRWLQEVFEASQRLCMPLLRLQPQQGVRLAS